MSGSSSNLAQISSNWVSMRRVSVRLQQLPVAVAFGLDLAFAPAEAEEQHRQQPLGLQMVEYRGRGLARVAPASRVAAGSAAALRAPAAAAAASTRVAPADVGPDQTVHPLDGLATLGEPKQTGRFVVQHVAQRHRSLGAVDHRQLLFANLLEPRAELLQVGDRGGQAHEAYVRGSEDDRSSSHTVPRSGSSRKCTLVEDDEIATVVEALRAPRTPRCGRSPWS